MDAPAWIDRALWPWKGTFHVVSGARLHVVDAGAGRPVLFVHGTPTWSIDWRHALAALSADHRCIAVDHLGFGLSDRPFGAGYRPEDHAARFAALADALDLSDLTLVVHDYGGPIALPWALENIGRLRHLVVLNSFAWPLDDRVQRVGARLLGTAFGRWLYRRFNLSLRFIAPTAWGDRSKLTDALYAQHLAPFEDPDARVEVLWPLAKALLGSEAHYAALGARLSALRDAPVSLVWGLKDHAFGPAVLARWQRIFPHATTTALADAGHWPHEEHPHALVDAIRRGG